MMKHHKQAIMRKDELMTSQQGKKQQRYEHLGRKWNAGMITTWESTERVKLYYELHPEEIFWTNGRTPAQIWGRWACLRRAIQSLFSGWHGEALRFALVFVAILAL